MICCTGTTAFPSKRWSGENTPDKVGEKIISFQVRSKHQFNMILFCNQWCGIHWNKGSLTCHGWLSLLGTMWFFCVKKDWEGVKNLISALPSSVKRVVLVSSVGVTKSNELPWRWDHSISATPQSWISMIFKIIASFLHLIVSTCMCCLTVSWTFLGFSSTRRWGKIFLGTLVFPSPLSGLEQHTRLYSKMQTTYGLLIYCIMIDILSRPGRLTDGPYTSYDLNTLLKATAGERRAVVIGQGKFEILGWSCCLREFEIACFT